MHHRLAHLANFSKYHDTYQIVSVPYRYNPNNDDDDDDNDDDDHHHHYFDKE